jgi:hypothetical protein
MVRNKRFIMTLQSEARIDCLPSNLGHAFRAKTNNSGGAARTIDLSYGIGKLVSTLLDDGFGWMAIRPPIRRDYHPQGGLVSSANRGFTVCEQAAPLSLETPSRSYDRAKTVLAQGCA